MSEKQKRKKTTSAFPKNTLLDALKLAQSIKDNNAGRPFNRLDLAKSLGYSPNSSGFRTLIVSSGKFGLTSGGYIAEKIELTPLGQAIVSPRTEQEKKDGLKTALFNVTLYQKFFSTFDNNKIPKAELIQNTLERDFGIPAEDTLACVEVILKNARELGIINEIKGNQYFQLTLLSSKTPQKTVEDSDLNGEELPERENNSDFPDQKDAAERQVSTTPRIFISHSKSKKIVDQIKQILEFGQFEKHVAMEFETTAIPIPDKIFGLMRECNCAIINLSADEQEKKEDGSYGINQNVLIEIGAAFLAYNKRVVLLVDRRIKLPSNLQGLAVIQYEGEELSFETAMRLQKTLTEFRKLE